jgi:hypothetical protein
MPVHIETMSAISSSPTSGWSASASFSRQFSSSSRFFCVSLRSLSRSEAAFSNSWFSIASSLSLRTRSISSSSSDAHTRAGLVDQVDRLVGQVAVLDVPVGERGCRVERLVGDPAAMMRLVAVAQAAQDLHGVVDGRLVDADLLEAPL